MASLLIRRRVGTGRAHPVFLGRTLDTGLPALLKAAMERPGPTVDVALDGDRLTWNQSITKPLRLSLAFAVTVDGDTMTGTSRAGRLPASKVGPPPRRWRRSGQTLITQPWSSVWSAPSSSNHTPPVAR
jgi:hypothetical protein